MSTYAKEWDKMISKRETIMVTHTTLDKQTFYITANAFRDTFYIYKEENGETIKLGRASNPIELEEKYIRDHKV